MQNDPQPPVQMPEKRTPPDIETLKETAKTMLEGLKAKYVKGHSKEALVTAASGAFSVWLKAATANPFTGEAQLTPGDLTSGVSSLERYFCQRLPEKR